MGYVLHGLVAAEAVLHRFAREYRSAVVVPLPSGLALVPLTDALYDEVQGDDADCPTSVPGFRMLSSALASSALRASLFGPVAYLEAYDVDDIATEAAAGWSQGSIVVGPFSGPATIDAALEELGFCANEDDVLDALGLKRHANPAAWVPAS